jgi:hypothetical protein
MMTKYSLLLLFAFLLTACGPQGSSGGEASAQPVSWFDTPLPGTILEVAPGPPENELPAVRLVSHHSDLNGISEIEFSVNDEIFESADVQEDESLITDTRDWIPPGPGEYTLRVRALSKDGSWGDYAETYVIIPEFLIGDGVVQGVVYAGLSQSPLDGVAVTLKGCGPDQTQTTAADGAFNFTGLPAGSCTVSVFKQDWSFISSIPDLGVYPVPVASDPDLPTAFSITMDLTNPFPEQSGFTDKSLSTFAVYDDACGPNVVSFRVHIDYPGELGSALLFYTLQTPGGASTGWNAGASMNSQGEGYYGLTVSGLQLAQGAAFEAGQISYQFVVEPANGDPDDFLRSPIYRDLQWAACDTEPEPEPEPQCSDGIDNDGDGYTDYAPPSIVGGLGDPDCTSPEDDSE